ncbi:hypothetical protein [Carboxylicivirga sp. RSCT41]|uniref:hypothetical protein n=1 Tax=Carboxylicivirga agarovorans TaxID=3417570 RepID=UPI003D34DB35
MTKINQRMAFGFNRNANTVKGGLGIGTQSQSPAKVIVQTFKDEYVKYLQKHYLGIKDVEYASEVYCDLSVAGQSQLDDIVKETLSVRSYRGIKNGKEHIKFIKDIIVVVEQIFTECQELTYKNKYSNIQNGNFDNELPLTETDISLIENSDFESMGFAQTMEKRKTNFTDFHPDTFIAETLNEFAAYYYSEQRDDITKEVLAKVNPQVIKDLIANDDELFERLILASMEKERNEK